MSESKKPIKVPEKKPRQFNRLAAATFVGMLIGVILAYTVGPKDVTIVLGTAIGALVGLVWDWLAIKFKK